MPELVNHTPFPNFRYYSKDAEGNEFGVVIVKGTFEIGQDGTLVRSEEQAPMMFTDACHGEVNVSSLWHPSDLVPHKPKTDVIVNALAHAPSGDLAPSWACGVRITGSDGVRLQKSLRVTGPREWVPKWKREPIERERAEWSKTGAWHAHRSLAQSLFIGWELSDPEPITLLPLRYEYAHGGEIGIGRDEDGEPIYETSHHNPIGRGLIDREATVPLAPVPAPQIEALDEPITDPFARPVPQSLGAIPPAWLPRRPLGGTYDRDWLDNRWPEWPKDYSFAYHQSAHPDMIVDGYLRGDETIEMRGLSRTGNVLFALPRLIPEVLFRDEMGRSERVRLDLDTVLIDATEPALADWRVFVSWRCRFKTGRWERAAIFLLTERGNETELAA